MATFTSFWQSVVLSIESFISAIDFRQHPYFLLDIIIIAVLFYFLYILIRGTRAVPILTGLVVLAAVALISQRLKLSALNWLLGHFFTLIVIAIPVVFRDELRKGLETIGQTKLFRPKLEGRGMRKVIHAIVDSCEALSTGTMGALIVLRRDTNLSEVIETGIPLRAEVSTELLLTIFFPGSPLHDGAVVIEGDKIAAASCVLPLALNTGGTKLGTRHKAALGIAEHTDAIAVVVSEEKGHISIAHHGELTQRVSLETLESTLSTLLDPHHVVRKRKKDL